MLQHGQRLKEADMIKIGYAGVIVLFVLLPNFCAADAPHKLGGFVLGGNIEDFKDKINPETMLPVRYAESIKEVEVRKIAGFKTGLVYYGTCNLPSVILRVEFKYEDSSKQFYEMLLKRFKKRHGDPDQWRGDPFHIEVGWKWKFIDENNNHISLVLKHNTQDEDIKEGNSVKMTMWNLMNKEIRCFKKKRKSYNRSAKIKRMQKSENIDWDLLIPR
jgi:hypothetical protein